MTLFRKRLRKTPEPTAQVTPFDAPIEPSIPFFAIGDIHGHLDKLKQLLMQIEQAEAQPTVVCVGDFIDRGEESAEVLRHLKFWTEEFGQRFVCLTGNHEHMCLQFLDDPEEKGERWLRNGGLQTLASYGVSRPPGGDIREIRDAVASAMGDELIAWLRALPAFWISGNVAVTHAGADPGQPIGAQSRRNLIWGHPGFQRIPRHDGIWVVHGHTMVDTPTVQHGRIAIDTGAYATGRLTAARISRHSVSFLTA